MHPGWDGMGYGYGGIPGTMVTNHHLPDSEAFEGNTLTYSTIYGEIRSLPCFFKHSFLI